MNIKTTGPWIHKAAYQHMKYEDTTEDLVYAFTFNPCDGLQEWNKTNRWLRVHDKVLEILKKMQDINYYLNLEISSGGRIHYHGYMIIKNKMRHFAYNINKLQFYGTYCIKKIDDISEWSQYISKQGFSDNAVISNCTYEHMVHKLEELQVIIDKDNEEGSEAPDPSLD